jgi:hypothetical protein
MSDSQTYQSPVNQLLKEIEGYKFFQNKWLDYPKLFGFTKDDLPELIRLGLDEDPVGCDENGEWMFHALIAVAQLDPVAAIDLYLQQLQIFPEDDLLMNEAEAICRNAGKAAIEPCRRFLQDIEQDEWYRMVVSDGIAAIAEDDPGSRDACVKVLMDQLHLYKLPDSDVVISALVDNLVKLKVVEAADLIQEVFENVDVDEFRTGSWPAVQVKLGLKSEADFTPEELKSTPPPQIMAIRESLEQLEKLQNLQRRQEAFAPKQSPLNFSLPKTVKPKSVGFGSTQPRPKKNKPKKK